MANVVQIECTINDSPCLALASTGTAHFVPFLDNKSHLYVNHPQIVVETLI